MRTADVAASALRDELLSMEAALRDAYAATRTGAGAAKPFNDVAYIVLDRLRQQHAQRLQEILRASGWPRISAVAADGACAAAWIACRCDNIEVQRFARAQMTAAVRLREAPVGAWAVLVDVIAVASGELQVYGTQTTIGPDGQLRPHAIADPTNVDARRRSVGLPPLGNLTRSTTTKGS